MTKQPERHEDRVERIVHDVLARLNGTGQRTREANTGESTTGSMNASKVAKEGELRTTATRAGEQRPNRLELAGHVITIAALRERLGGIDEVDIPCGAVVTPAARDLLQDAGVRLVRQSRQGIADRRQRGTLAIGVAQCAMEPAAAARLADVYAGPIQHVARTGLVDVVRSITEQVVFDGARGVLFTDAAAMAVCLANRRTGVRAVLARCIEDAEADSEAVAANLLVIDPARLSTWQQLRLVRVFAAHAAACPPDLEGSEPLGGSG